MTMTPTQPQVDFDRDEAFDRIVGHVADFFPDLTPEEISDLAAEVPGTEASLGYRRFATGGGRGGRLWAQSQAVQVYQTGVNLFLVLAQERPGVPRRAR